LDRWRHVGYSQLGLPDGNIGNLFGIRNAGAMTKSTRDLYWTRGLSRVQAARFIAFATQ
jgi:hypothetical protein